MNSFQPTLLLRRIEGIRAMLLAANSASSGLSSASKGREREIFVGGFLDEVFPPTYRFGSGDIVDASNHHSGQIDVVIELPYAPSVPLMPGSEVRLFLAEGVGAAIEVKSDLNSQWSEVLSTAQKLEPIRRNFTLSLRLTETPIPDCVPLFVVGYKGWANHDTYEKHLRENPTIAGILSIEQGVFACKTQIFDERDGKLKPGYGFATGADSLWALVSAIHHEVQRISLAFVDLGPYGMPADSIEIRRGPLSQ